MKNINQGNNKPKKTPSGLADIIVYESVIPIAIDLIEPSPFEPQARRRRKFKDADIESLGDSIIKHKLRQPIQVRPKSIVSGNSKKYEIVFGERRWLASKRKGLEKINCFVDVLSDTEVIELQYEENHKRQDPDPLDDAFYCKYLMDKGYSILDLQIKFSMSYDSVRDRVKLNDLIPEAKEQLSSGQLPLGHAVYMAKFPVAAQKEIVDEGYAYKWNDPEEGTVPYNEFKAVIAENVERRIVGAPFDPEDERLHIKGLKCSDCRDRKYFEAKLFDEPFKDKDACLNKICFEAKTNDHLRLSRNAIAEQTVKTESKKFDDVVVKVPLVTSRKYVQREDIPFTEKVLVNQTFLPEKECEFSELSLIVDGPDKGQQTYICRKNDCPVHHPQPVISKTDAAALQKRENEFNELVLKNLRREIFTEAMKPFDDYKPVWMFDDLVQVLIFRLFNSVEYDSRKDLLEIVREWKIFPKNYSNATSHFELKEAISKLSKAQQSQFIFLLIFGQEWASSAHYDGYLKQMAKDYTKINYGILDAQTRVFLAPEEFKPVAQKYLDDLRDGKEPAIPSFWVENTEDK